MADDKKEDSRTKLYELIADEKIAMLTTVEADGRLHTRPMANQEADHNGDIWFFTEKNGAIASELASNTQVSLGYADGSGGTYVSISGTGDMVHDRATIEAKWTEDNKAWFPKGKEDPNIALLRVTPDRGEFWDFNNSTLVTAVAYVKSKITGTAGDDLGDNRKVQL